MTEDNSSARWPIAEPTPFRDNGPYDGPQDALAQYRAVTHAIPGDLAGLNRMVIAEALLMSGVTSAMTEYERDVLLAIGVKLTEDQAQVLAGWIIRALLKGIGQRAERMAP